MLNAQNWNSGRQILTYKPSAALGSRGVAFRWPANPASPTATEPDAALATALNKDILGATDGYGAYRLEYLRGNTAREVTQCPACTAPTFRNRSSTVLGDIINSAPVYVGTGTADYRDSMESARYSTYVAARNLQTPMIYVGANDGMLHGFNGGTGAEVFAYVPWAVRDKLSALTSSNYAHQFTVDGSPTVGDVYYGGAWRTALVSGMNSGAKGLFALDVSDPSKFTESTAAQVARWEIDATDGDIGYIFSRPLLVKTKDGKWRAIVGNGYNSANGHAVLLLIDVQTGAVTKVDTGSGSAGTPNGLSGVAVVSSANNEVADIAYAGDLYGNLWKFDLSSATPSSWNVPYTTSSLPAPLLPATTGQPITARPDVTRHPQGGYMVSVGTGRYIDINDSSTTTGQSIYGVWDKGIKVLNSELQTQTIVSTATGSDGQSYRLSTYAVGVPPDTPISGDNAISVTNYYANKRGWKMSLPTSGERVISEATVRGGRLITSTVIPSTAICSAGGDGWLMEVDVLTGNRSPAFDTNADNNFNAADFLAGTMTSGVRVGSVPSAPSIIRNGKNDDVVISTSDGSRKKYSTAATVPPSRRSAWEQVK